MSDILKKEELEFEEMEENEKINSKYDIDYEISSFSIRDIISYIDRKKIILPEFQRDNSWSIGKKSLFIDSLLLNLPIPTIILYEKDKKLYLIDGGHRLRSIGEYRKGEFYITTRKSNFSGKRFETLTEELQDDFEDYRIPYIKFSETSPETGDSVYEVFNRINSKSEPLSQQEIRNAVYYSPYLKELKELVSKFKFEKLNEEEYKKKYIIKDKQTEIVVRYLAYSDYYNSGETSKKNKNQIIDMYLEKAQCMGDEEQKRYAVDEFSKFEENYLKFNIFKKPFHWKNTKKVTDMLVESFLIAVERLDKFDNNWEENGGWLDELKMLLEKEKHFNKATTNYSNFLLRVKLLEWHFKREWARIDVDFKEKLFNLEEEVEGQVSDETKNLPI